MIAPCSVSIATRSKRYELRIEIRPDRHGPEVVLRVLGQLSICLVDRFDYDEAIEGLDELVGQLRVARSVLMAKMVGRSQEVLLRDDAIRIVRE